MASEETTYLQLCLHGDAYQSAMLEFTPHDVHRDGIWVHTKLTIGTFKSEFAWFLESSTQQELASIHRNLARGNLPPQFSIYDTDHSFAARFQTNPAAEACDINIEVRCWMIGSGPVMTLDVRHASAPLAEVARLLDRLSHFG